MVTVLRNTFKAGRELMRTGDWLCCCGCCCWLWKFVKNAPRPHPAISISAHTRGACIATHHTTHPCCHSHCSCRLPTATLGTPLPPAPPSPAVARAAHQHCPAATATATCRSVMRPLRRDVPPSTTASTGTTVKCMADGSGVACDGDGVHVHAESQLQPGFWPNISCKTGQKTCLGGGSVWSWRR